MPEGEPSLGYVQKTWELFSERLKAADETLAAFTPWLIGLDAAIVGVTLSSLRYLEDQPTKFKAPIGLGLLLLMVSFIAGVLFKKKEVELKQERVTEAKDQFLIAQANVMRSARGEPPSPEINQLSDHWYMETKKVTRLEKQLVAIGKTTFDTFLVGIVLLASGFLALLFRPEFHELRSFIGGSCR